LVLVVFFFLFFFFRKPMEAWMEISFHLQWNSWRLGFKWTEFLLLLLLSFFFFLGRCFWEDSILLWLWIGAAAASCFFAFFHYGVQSISFACTFMQTVPCATVSLPELPCLWLHKLFNPTSILLSPSSHLLCAFFAPSLCCHPVVSSLAKGAWWPTRDRG
jgi:hypothetical protein